MANNENFIMAFFRKWSSLKYNQIHWCWMLKIRWKSQHHLKMSKKKSFHLRNRYGENKKAKKYGEKIGQGNNSTKKLHIPYNENYEQVMDKNEMATPALIDA